MDMKARIGQKLALVGALGLAASLLAACAASEGISQADFEAVSRQVAAKDQQLAEKDKELAAAQQKLKEKEGVTTLIGAIAKATPTPAPTATPLPIGAAPPPPRVVPVAYREPVPFTVYVETLATANVYQYGIASTVPCTESSVFKRGQRIVWRFNVVDTSTGKHLVGDAGEVVKLRLAHGEEVTGRFSQRAGGRVPDAPWMWNAAWDIPPTYPLGGLDYVFNIATKDGREFTWKVPAMVAADGSFDTRVKIID
ncbi:MAG: hypothetical protein HYY05_07955 [Chloroflexi bacterium]|nr:hypothetical protein [Chloroflexota bacterium]